MNVAMRAYFAIVGLGILFTLLAQPALFVYSDEGGQARCCNICCCRGALKSCAGNAVHGQAAGRHCPVPKEDCGLSSPCSTAPHSWVLPSLPKITLECAPVLPALEVQLDPYFRQAGSELPGYLPALSHPPECLPAFPSDY